MHVKAKAITVPTNDKYENLRAQRRAAQASYDAATGRIEECEYKISEIKRTKATLSEE